MPVDIVIGNIESRIVGHLDDHVHQELDDLLSYQLEGIEYSPRVISGQWDGYTRLYRKNRGQSFYSGLLSIVAETLEKNNIQFRKMDRRERPAQNLPHLAFTPPPNYEERDYQQFSIDRAINKTRGIFKIATGGGKTMITSELIARLKTGPFMFYVLTRELMDQAHETLSRTINEPIGRIGNGECDIKMINVCTIQTAIRAINMENKRFDLSDYTFDEEDADLWKEGETFSIEKQQMIRKVIQSAKGLFVDEMHHAAASTVRDIITASPYAYWKYGGSATPYREDGADLMLQALFGKKIVDINASYLIERGFLCTPYIIFDPIHHNTPLHSYKSIYKNCIADNRDFNSHVADLAKFLTQKDLSTLILVQQIKHGKLIQSFMPEVPFVTGETSDKMRRQAINDLKSKKSKCLIATTLADEGLDVPTLDAALLAGGGASCSRVNQRIGRTLRIDKSVANPRNKSIVVYFDHKAKYLEKHTRKAKKIIKTEPKFNIVNSQGALYIKREIEEIMDLKLTQKTLFD